MKRSVCVLLAVLGFAVGCDYRAPLSADAEIPIDKAVLGLWESVPSLEAPSRLLVIKDQENQYLIHAQSGTRDQYFRAYPIKLGGIVCLQVQAVDLAKGKIMLNENQFQVVAYTVANNELEIKTLNPAQVDQTLPDSAALRRAFLDNKDSKDLFTDPHLFLRVPVKKGMGQSQTVPGLKPIMKPPAK